MATHLMLTDMLHYECTYGADPSPNLPVKKKKKKKKSSLTKKKNKTKKLMQFKPDISLEKKTSLSGTLLLTIKWKQTHTLTNRPTTISLTRYTH